MKQQILLIMLLLSAWGARAQTLLQQQSFEGTGTDALAANAYTATAVPNVANQYFIRTDLAGMSGAGRFTAGSTVANINGIAPGSAGTYFWASENVRRNGSVVLGNPPADLTLTPLNVAGKASLSVTVALADATGLPGGTGIQWETDDYVRIQYRFNGTGVWNTIGQFVGDGTAGGGPPPSGGLRRDANLDGVADASGTLLNQNLTDFNFPISGSGNTLEVRVEIDQDGRSEEFGFDNIRVYGSAAASAAPVLSNLETATISYNEGSGATPITSALTVSDVDNTTLSGATVRIITNYDNTEDRLLFTNQNGISGSFNTTTGAMTLTGVASLAAYQAALRSIQYQDIDAIDASGLTRTVSFAVTDASGVVSTDVTRNIAVNPALDPASPPTYTETFENDGEGTRYSSSHFYIGDETQFQRVTANPVTGSRPTTFTNVAGAGYWFGVNTSSTFAGNGTLITKQVNAAGFRNLHFQILLGASVPTGLANSSSWLSTNTFQLFYRTAGSSTWTAFGLFRGSGATFSDYGAMRQDANPTGTGTPTGTQLTAALQNFDFALPAALDGQTLDFRAVLTNLDASNDFAFDQIQVTGTQAPAVTTTVPASVTTNSAVLAGNVTADGGATVTDRGVVYSSTNTTPTTGDTKVQIGTGTGSFSTVPAISGLTPGTTYYVRAYGINSVGTGYGAVQSFTTATTVVSIVRATSSPTNASSVSYTVTFASSVTGFGVSNLSLTTSGLSSASVTSVSGSGATYTAVVNTGSGSGTAQLNLANSTGITPSVYNAPFAGEVYAIDRTAPTVSISSSAGASGSTTSTSPIPFTVTFSEAVAGFSAGDPTVTNGTISGFSGSGTTYTFNVTPSANGAVTVNVPAAVAQDAAGNGNTAASQFTITYSQPVTAAPVVTSPANGSFFNTTTPTHVGTAVANSTVTVYVDGTSIGTTTATAGGGFSLVQPTALAQGSHTVRATAQLSGQAVSANSGTNTFTVDTVAPTVAISSTAGASGSTTNTSPVPFTVTFSETVTGFVAGALTVTNGTVSGFSGSGTTYAFNVTPTTAGTVTTVNVAANGAQDAAGNGNTAASPFSITYTLATATVVSVTRLLPTATATASVSYKVVFSASVTGISLANFSLTTTGLAGASISSASGAGSTYTVTVTTGTGDGTLRLNVANSTGLSPSVTNTPYTAGEVYTITKSFAAAPQLTVQGTGGTGSDVTAFVDVVQVLQGGVPFANALQNGSFETHDPLGNTDFGYNPTGASWTFNSRSGIAENGSAFSPATAPSGIAVAFVQSTSGINGQLQQNLALPTGSYQVGFQTSQRTCCSTADQVLNVFLNGVFLGTIQPVSTTGYSPFTSATFSVTAPALTASITSTATSPTATSPVPVTVTFSASVTGFVASDVTVGNGTVSGFSGSGSTYTFNVTPATPGTVTVNVPANGASDANNTGNAAAPQFSILYQPVTAAPAVTNPANGSTTNGNTPAYAGTAAASSSITVYVDGASIGTTTATVGGAFSLTQPTSLTDGSHAVYATAQASGSSVSANSGTNTFTVDTAAPNTSITSTPPNPSNSTTASFAFTGTDGTGSGVASYQASLDGSAFAAATSPRTYTGLAAGSHTFQVRAIDNAGNVGAPASYTWTIDLTAPTVAISSSAGASGSSTGTTPIPFTVTFSEAVTGFISSDVTVGNGTISGFAGSGSAYTFNVTPATAGTATTVNVPANVAQDAAGNANTAAPSAYALTFAAPTIVVSPATLLGGTVAVAYSQTLSASGGTAPYTFAITAGALPTGLSLTTAGVLAGTPTASGSFSFIVRATDAAAAPGPFNGSRSYTLTITAPTIAVAPSTLPTGTQGTAYSQALTASGGTAPYSFAVTAGALPTGLTLSAAGALAGTPTAGGTFNFTVTATDASTAPGPYSGSRAYSVTISTQPVTAAPVITSPANNSFTNQPLAISGTAPANSTVLLYLSQNGGPFNPASFTATAAGTFSTGPLGFPEAIYQVYGTAQSSGAAVSANSATITFTVDTTRPTVAISSTAGASGGTTGTTPIPFTVTFSEAVTGFISSGVTVGNGTVSGFSGSGATYTFTVTPTAAGPVTVDVAANGGQDAAGNGNTAASPFSITYTVPITVSTWAGTTSTDWYTASNWTAGVPTAALDASIPAGAPRYPVVAAGTAPMKNLAINSGATVTQTGGTISVSGTFTKQGTYTATGGTVALAGSTTQGLSATSLTRFVNLSIGTAAATLTSGAIEVSRVLTLNGNLTTNGNGLTLLSGSAGDALVNNNGGVVVGTATVQRYIDPTLNANLGYRHYSAPVSNSTVADLATTGFTPAVNSAYNTSATPSTVSPFPTVFGYDQSRLNVPNNYAPFDKGWYSPASLGDALTPGLGYTVNLNYDQLVDFTGTLNNGALTVSLASNRSTYTEGGWQLVGNPYPAPLDYSLVAPADRTGLEGAIFVYSSTGPYVGQYRVYINGIGGNPIIASGQGFITRVAAGQPAGSLTFRNANRLTAPTATTFQRSTAETRPLVQLTLRGANARESDHAYVYFENGATAGFDAQYDAAKLLNPTGLNLSAVVAGQRVAVNGLPTGSTAAVTVPLTIGLPATGTYTLHAEQVLNFAPGAQPFLRDLQLNTLTDLRQQPTYTFTMNAANTTPRFELVFGPQQVLGTASAALAAQVAVFPNPASTAVSVELPAGLSRTAVSAALVDALGRVVLTQVLPAGRATHTLPLAGIASGVYALRLQTDAGLVVKKLVVE